MSFLAQASSFTLKVQALTTATWSTGPEDTAWDSTKAVERNPVDLLSNQQPRTQHHQKWTSSEHTELVGKADSCELASSGSHIKENLAFDSLVQSMPAKEEH